MVMHPFAVFMIMMMPRNRAMLVIAGSSGNRAMMKIMKHTTQGASEAHHGVQAEHQQEKCCLPVCFMFPVHRRYKYKNGTK